MYLPMTILRVLPSINPAVMTTIHTICMATTFFRLFIQYKTSRLWWDDALAQSSWGTATWKVSYISSVSKIARARA